MMPSPDVQQEWFSVVTLSNNGSLSDQIYTQIRSAIVTGKISPSTTLNEPMIAQFFGVSRTPVREAVLRLRDHGLVYSRRQSATYVASVDLGRVEEGILMRDALEPRIAGIAASRMNDRILSELTFETDRMEKAAAENDSATFLDADDIFHYVLTDASGFSYIAESIRRVTAQLDRIRYLSVAEPTRAKTSIRQHRKLIRLLKLRDESGSAELLQTHLRGSWVLIRRYSKRISSSSSED